MDGLKDTVPFGEPENDFVQLSFFDEPEEKEEKSDCIIKSWKTNKEIKFKSIKEGKEMKFDFVIGNPPYQEDTNGAGRQAKPIYPLFVNSAISLSPQAIVMIAPSRWFSGGMGLNEFRKSMLTSNHLHKIYDYTNSKDCFPNISISGGVSIFVWKDQITDKCIFSNVTNNKVSTMERELNKFDTFIRYNQAVSLIHKVKEKTDEYLENIISSLMPYGLNTNYRGEKEYKDGLLTLYSSNDVTYVEPAIITKGQESISTYRVMISKTSAEHAGEPSKDGKFRVIPSSIKVIKPNEICTHSYFYIGSWDNKIFADNCLKYLKTQFVRTLMLMCISGFGFSKTVFPFVPLQDFTENSDIDWTKSIAEIDKQLYKKYNLSQEEIDFIESHVKEME